MTIYHQSTFERWPFDDGSVQAIITSPPYWKARVYDLPGHIEDQYGQEDNFLDYIEKTLSWIDEAKRALRPDGVMFIVIDDSYNRYKKGNTDEKNLNINNMTISKKLQKGIQVGCKLLIPERIMVGMSARGWIIPNSITWFKPNAKPEPHKRRCTHAKETVIFAAKSSQYKFCLDNIRVPMKAQSIAVPERCHPLGKNPGDVWAINTQPRKDYHFAMFPDKLVERMILCSTQKGDIVLDPFVGSGTTVSVAEKLGRIGHGIDLGYKDIQDKRLKGPALPLYD